MVAAWRGYNADVRVHQWQGAHRGDAYRVPYQFGGADVTAPTDPGLYMYSFALHPGKYQPSGHFNTSRARELYLNYTSTFIGSDAATTATFFVQAKAINFLLISELQILKLKWMRIRRKNSFETRISVPKILLQQKSSQQNDQNFGSKVKNCRFEANFYFKGFLETKF